MAIRGTGSTTKTRNVRVENDLSHLAVLAVVVGLKNRLHITGCCRARVLHKGTKVEMVIIDRV